MTSEIQTARDNRANQLNPEHPAFYLSRGLSPTKAEEIAREVARSARAHAKKGVDPIMPCYTKHSDRKGKPQEKSSE